MAKPTGLFFPIEKAIYLLTRESLPGEGGDKKKFWTEVLGFDSPENVREAILRRLTVNDLKFQRMSQHGERYQAISLVEGQTGNHRILRTGWIVRHEETIARFVTAIPQKKDS